jgi:hypothetical protein
VLAAALAIGSIAAMYGLRLPAAAADPPVVVVYAKQHSEVLRSLSCPGERCRFVTIETLVKNGCGARVPGHTVILVGHAMPPTHLGVPAEDVATAVSCFRPDLLVIDMAYGFSASLFEALASSGQSLLVAGGADVPCNGLQYDEQVFGDGDTMTRARGITRPNGSPITRWPLDVDDVRSARAAVAGWGPLQIEQKEVVPGLMRAPLPDGGNLLVRVPSN